MKVNLGDKSITIRKWKGKDKKDFLNRLKTNQSSPISLMEPLVYPCVEEDVILSLEEFRFVLTKIRAYSLGEEIEFNFYCKKCEKDHNQTLKLSDVIRYAGGSITDIKVGELELSLGEVKNKEIYQKLIEQDELFDLILRIQKVNGDDAYTLDDLIEYFDNLDVDVLEDVLTEWDNIRFKVDDENDITCPHCGNVTTYSFDEIPGFLPDSWHIK